MLEIAVNGSKDERLNLLAVFYLFIFGRGLYSRTNADTDSAMTDHSGLLRNRCLLCRIVVI